MMKLSLLLLAVVGMTNAFQVARPSLSTSTSSALFAYIPDGFTAATWKKYQNDEKKKQQQKSLDRVGPRGFQSRSMQSFQEALERGEATHLMPVFNAKEKIKAGKIRPEDVPYMQRGGKWDNTDIKGAKNKKKWLNSDKEYSSGGFKKEQSVSIFGVGKGLDWTGQQDRSGPSANGAGNKKKKGFFGF